MLIRVLTSKLLVYKKPILPWEELISVDLELLIFKGISRYFNRLLIMQCILRKFLKVSLLILVQVLQHHYRISSMNNRKREMQNGFQ